MRGDRVRVVSRVHCWRIDSGLGGVWSLLRYYGCEEDGRWRWVSVRRSGHSRERFEGILEVVSGRVHCEEVSGLGPAEEIEFLGAYSSGAS